MTAANGVAQQPSTFGKDRYVLTNPPDLRMLNTGFIAEIGGRLEATAGYASFLAVKSYGPTNPGNTGARKRSRVIGALFLDQIQPSRRWPNVF